MAEARIYNYDSKTDGWKRLGGAPTKTIKIDQKLRGIQEYDIPLTHYVKGGVALCGEAAGIGDATFYNDPRNQCSACKQKVREQTLEAKALEKAKDESKNVIDYKAAAAKDKPESSSVSH